METLEAPIRKQFQIAQRRGHFNRDTFRKDDRVRIKDGKGKCSIKGKIEETVPSPDGSTHTYRVLTDDGRVFTQNGSWIHHSESPAETEEERAEA